MSDSVVRVSRQSWGGRLGGSIKGIFVGVVLALASLALLFWNEGRAVERARTLAEGAGAVVSVPSAAVDAGNEGKLVHTQGEAATGEELRDPLFGVAVTALALERQVEMYQWVEHQRSEERKKLGGSTETVTTYTYERTWASGRADSSGFEQPSGHENPELPFPGETWRAADVRLGAFRLDPALASDLDRREDLPVSEDTLAGVDPLLRDRLKVTGEGFYLGADPASAEVGDVRVRFRVVRPAAASVVAAQRAGVLGPYQTRAGGEIALVTYGDASAEQMFQAARTANTALTWMLRLVGFVLLFAGIRSVLRPLQVLADVVPMVGRLVGGGVSLAAFALAVPLALITVALGWLFFRPLVGAALLAAGLAAAVWLWRRSRRPKAAFAPPPAMVPPPPPPAPAG
jgi:hypothetical protein